jgi:hypothetical protein
MLPIWWLLPLWSPSPPLHPFNAARPHPSSPRSNPLPSFAHLRGGSAALSHLQASGPIALWFRTPPGFRAIGPMPTTGLHAAGPVPCRVRCAIEDVIRQVPVPGDKDATHPVDSQMRRPVTAVDDDYAPPFGMVRRGIGVTLAVARIWGSNSSPTGSDPLLPLLQ